jgi:hypothetical protein
MVDGSAAEGNTGGWLQEKRKDRAEGRDKNEYQAEI